MLRAELKSMAKQQIKGKIGILFVITIIVAVVSVVASVVLGLIPIIGSLIASIVVTPALSLSIYKIYLDMTHGAEPKVEDTFYGFKDFWSAFKVTFFVGLFTALWSLLFVIPGIIKSFSYAQAWYILAENPGMPALEAINRSKAMMNGHKMDMFILGLSFIGWCLLGTITLGIAFIWVGPYMNATMANFYNSIKPVEENVATASVEA